MKISVCIATFNGENYILYQINSILSQLSETDEVIIVDDASHDDTVNLIKSLNDKRVDLLVNKSNLGHVKSFSTAMELAKGDIVFLSDQDDIWLPNRLKTMIEALKNSRAYLLTSNSIFINSKGDPIEYNLDGVQGKNSTHNLGNIIDIFLGKTNYFGCAMVYKKELNEIILPIPQYVESHDLWMAIASNLMGLNLHIDEPTFKRRIHNRNASIIQRNIIKKLKSRFIFCSMIIDLAFRIIKKHYEKTI